MDKGETKDERPKFKPWYTLWGKVVDAGMYTDYTMNMEFEKCRDSLYKKSRCVRVLNRDRRNPRGEHPRPGLNAFLNIVDGKTQLSVSHVKIPSMQSYHPPIGIPMLVVPGIVSSESLTLNHFVVHWFGTSAGGTKRPTVGR